MGEQKPLTAEDLARSTDEFYASKEYLDWEERFREVLRQKYLYPLLDQLEAVLKETEAK
jgi:hypothetical protein